MTEPQPAPVTLEKMHPAYFALVMATGSISLAAFLLEFHWIAWGLFAFNIGAYASLWILYALRTLFYPHAVLSDLADHARGVGFFTIIAGTCVLGSQCVVIADAPAAGFALWCVGIALWMLLIYGVLTLLTVRGDKPTLVKGINGGWLVSVVAAQSVSILGSQLVNHIGTPAREPVIFFAW